MGDQWVRRFNVDDPQRHSKGFTVYKVTSTIFPKKSPEAKTEIVVWKRFSEFQKLHKELKSRHEKLHLKDQFPPFSKPRLFGRFESDVIEERRLAAQALLDFTSNHPTLFTSQACVKFFEKSHKELHLEVRDDNVEDQSTVTRECDHVDTVSQSSSHSTLTDTDSTISITSFPSQQDETSKPGNGSATPTETTISTTIPSSSCPQSSAKFQNISNQNCVQQTEDLVGTYTSPPEETSITVENDNFTSSDLSSKAMPKFDVTASYPKQLEEGQHTSSNASLDSAKHSLEGSLNVGCKSPNKADFSRTTEAMDYITNAGFHISEAVEHETNSHFEQAFASYKAAISCLLSGVQDDPSEERKSLVQRKATQYLIRAEQIYHNHLEVSYTTTRTIPGAKDISFIQVQNVAVRNWKSLEAPMSDLKMYKVLGIVSTVILALNTRDDTPYIVKVLHKSPCPVDRRTKSIVPCNVPFMCQLHSVMENDRAVFLVLEQARGGRLWDHINPYFEMYENLHSSRTAFAQFLTDVNSEDRQSTLNNNQTEACDCGVTVNYPEDGLQATFCDGKSEQPPLSLNVQCMKEEQAYGVIPDVVIQKAKPTASGVDTKCSISVPDVLPVEGSHTESVGAYANANTEDILKSSQKLLESVNNTLSMSEKATKAYVHCQRLTVDRLFQEGGISAGDLKHEVTKSSKNRCASAERVPLIARDQNRSISRDRKTSASRRPRSRIRFSCDDMFEGRARALSRSLDREALQRVDPKDSQNTYPGLPIDAVRLWAAQLLLALDALHRWGVVIGDMRPENLLLGCGLNLVLTYQCHWVCVDRVINSSAIEELYAAPEVGSIQEITTAADWWSYGAILFELLSGETLHSYHPGGLHSYSTLCIPSSVPEEGANLLRQLLRFEAQNRLGAGPHGVAKLKSHLFFRGIEWNKVLLMSASV